MKFKLITIILLISSGCTTPEEKVSGPDLYFSMEKLVEDQIAILTSGAYQLRKTAILNGDTDNRLMEPDSLGWRNELKLFKDADINLPSLQGLYEKVEGPGELNNNLSEVDYLPIKEIQGVQYIKVFFAENLVDVRKVEARVTEINPLYYGETILKLELRRDGENNLVLNSYEISGGQKMIMMDSVNYKITGDIRPL